MMINILAKLFDGITEKVKLAQSVMQLITIKLLDLMGPFL